MGKDQEYKGFPLVYHTRKSNTDPELPEISSDG